MILGFLAMTLGGLIEMFYLGLVGTKELAAATFAFPIAMLLNAMTRGIGVGASTLVAQSMGRGDQEGTSETITHCFSLVMLITVSASAVCWLIAPIIFRLLGAEAEVLSMVTQYFRIWLIGFPMMGLAMVANAQVRAFGNPNLPGLIIASAPITQAIVGPFLIFGLLGLPALGLNGAAWAFIIGTTVQSAIVLNWFLLKEKLYYPSFKRFTRSTKRILHVGIPAAMTNMIQPISAGVVTWLLAGFGTNVLAGFGVATRIESVVAMVVIGIGTSVVPFVGQNWGARKFDRAYTALNTCYAFAMGWGVIAATIMWFNADYFVSVINDDPNLVETAVTFLHIVPFSIGFMGLIQISNHAFNALRKPMSAMILSISRLLIVYIPLALILSNLYGYVGVFVATALANVLIGIVAVIWNRTTLRKEERRLQVEDLPD
jgi:putative MATE family efflux protein